MLFLVNMLCIYFRFFSAVNINDIKYYKNILATPRAVVVLTCKGSVFCESDLGEVVLVFFSKLIVFFSLRK